MHRLASLATPKRVAEHRYVPTARCSVKVTMMDVKPVHLSQNKTYTFALPTALRHGDDPLGDEPRHHGCRGAPAASDPTALVTMEYTSLTRCRHHPHQPDQQRFVLAPA